MSYRDKFTDSFAEPNLIDLAIWFHDVIYDSSAKPGKNEDDSVSSKALSHCFM